MESVIRSQLQGHRAVIDTIEQQLVPAIAAAGDLLAKRWPAGRSSW